MLKVFEGQTPEVLRGRLRLEPRFHSIAMEAYADGSVYIRTDVGWQLNAQDSVPMLNFTFMEYSLLALLHAAAKYADWTGAYGDVDVLAVLDGPDKISPSTAPLVARHIFPGEARERTDTSPVHATSTLEALASDPMQLQACARRIASDLVADLGYVETTLLKPDGKILSARLEPKARENIELWMRAVGLPVHE